MFDAIMTHKDANIKQSFGQQIQKTIRKQNNKEEINNKERINMVDIMIVEDEKPISKLIALSLKKAGYHCECAYDGLEALDMLDQHYPDLILLDIMLPGADGFEILEYVKPFEIMELLARIEVVLRRYKKLDRMIRILGLEIDTDSRIVTKNEIPINLTKKEYDILLLFARNPENVLRCETIYERVWGGDYIPGSRTVDLHVQRVRKKAEWEDYLISVPKMGYRLEVPK